MFCTFRVASLVASCCCCCYLLYHRRTSTGIVHCIYTYIPSTFKYFVRTLHSQSALLSPWLLLSYFWPTLLVTTIVLHLFLASDFPAKLLPANSAHRFHCCLHFAPFTVIYLPSTAEICLCLLLFLPSLLLLFSAFCISRSLYCAPCSVPSSPFALLCAMTIFLWPAKKHFVKQICVLNTLYMWNTATRCETRQE